MKRFILSIKLDRNIKDQLGRASFSIVLNIAEGSGRFSKPDRRNFFIISRGSVFECVAILDILSDQKLIDDFSFLIRKKKYFTIGEIVWIKIYLVGCPNIDQSHFEIFPNVIRDHLCRNRFDADRAVLISPVRCEGGIWKKVP